MKAKRTGCSKVQKIDRILSIRQNHCFFYKILNRIFSLLPYLENRTLPGANCKVDWEVENEMHIWMEDNKREESTGRHRHTDSQAVKREEQ